MFTNKHININNSKLSYSQENFPKLSNSNNTNNKNSNISNQRRIISANFFERNYDYYLNKKQREQENYKFLSSNQLNMILYKFKNIYNELLNMNSEIKSELNYLNDLHEKTSNKKEQIHNFKEMTLENEKIAIPFSNETQIDISSIEETIIKLNSKKKNIANDLKNEKEYSKTLEYMYEDEKLKLQKINDEIILYEGKIESLNNYKKIIDENIENKKLKKKYFRNTIKKLNNDIEAINNIIENEEEKEKKYSILIENKENRNNNLKEYFNYIEEKNKNDLEEYIKDVKNKIYTFKENERMKIEKEKTCIEVILCLNFIQKYFLEQQENYEKKDLVNSNDYYDFEHDRFFIYDEDGNTIYHTKKNTLFKSTNKNFSLKSKNPKLMLKRCASAISPIHQKAFKISPNSKIIKISLNELVNIFNNLHITYESLFEYISKLNNKIIFSQNILSLFNKKAIENENKKSVGYEKVKNIINKDYSNFIDLMSQNSKFQKFLEKNKDFIELSYEKNEKLKQKKINKSIIEKKLIPKKKNPIEHSSNELYKLFHSILRENKDFFEFFYNFFSKNEIIEEFNFFDNFYEEMTFFQSYNFLEYLDKLINYEKDEELSKKLLNVKNYFYKNENNNNENNYNEKLLNRFLLQEIPKEKEFFYFIENSEKFLDFIKKIKEFTNKYTDEFNENENLLSQKKEEKKEKNNNSIYKSLMNKKKPEKKINSNTQKDFFSQKSFTTDNESLSENETTKVENKKINYKKNSIDERISKKLYEPFIEKILYKKNLNVGINKIKELTSSFSKDNYTLKKKKEKIDEMSSQFFVFKNPLLNINQLSNSSYNSLINYFYHNKINNKNSNKSKNIINKK